MMPLTKPSAMLAAVILIAACAEAARWENPNLSPDQWRDDEAGCRRQAAAEVERETTREQMYSGEGAMRRGDFAAAMGRFEAAKRRDARFAACMTARGYGAAKP